jgi:uncharacterized protein
VIQSVTYHALETGPRLLVLGAVHGNEVCGTIAIRRVLQAIEAEEITPLRGRISFVPICNPRAYSQQVRYTERNLNRNLLPQNEPDCYEAKLGNVLCPLLADCDALLDLHSYHRPGEAYVFIDPPDARALEFAAALGVNTALSNFAGAYALSEGGPVQPPDWSIGTTEYAHSHGALSVTLECGQHQDPAAPEIAYQAILGAMRFLNMLAPTTKPAPEPVKHIRVEKVFYRPAGGEFAQDWYDLDLVPKGTLIAQRGDGSAIIADRDYVMIIPCPDAAIGDEWFYLGVAV